MWRACPEFLRHKELLISPTLLEQNGIPFTRMMQKPGEFVVTYPGSYHSGFNCGYNCAESCNFATEAWVEIGEDAGVCECVPDAVSLDMRIFGDLCTRCHDTDSETESESESEEASESGAGASEMKLGKSRATAADAARRARLGSAGGRATRKRAASVSSDDDEKKKKKKANGRSARSSRPPRSRRALTEKKVPAVAKRRGDGRKDVLGARGVDALGGDARRARRAPPRGPGAPPERGGRPRHVLHLPRRRGG
jgi:jumonji domain-containing protein 2